MSTNPSAGRSTNSNIRWLKPDQVEAMRDAAHEGRHGPRDDAIVTLLYDTGLRRGELVQVDRAMLDLDEEQLRIPASIQKDYPNDNSPSAATFQLDPSGDLRTVRTLRMYLGARDDDSAALFPSRKSDRMSGKGINDVVKRAARRADVQPFAYAGRGEPDDVSAHTLRHSVAWRMLRAEEGNTLYDVRNRLRHATILTTERKYDHFETI
ncbi:integrase/recombinase XerC/integrase/recombinase XerD [Natronoarchaeum philippinense]|uniref:Integrase/recombinase XerC/integrase/recombinase XerD n=1 Tax=Natronoarchaeum philippinense TaxID=558529 RepID=A0A285N9C2_NATPI|nr:tyrosine-type recombinase/integrase [Natronoarchaeum philippinense]SNZ06104.1 integrase/recombinase XerC/integrase/recombinase XerD [Natronoarchaeum philippinense]